MGKLKKWKYKPLSVLCAALLIASAGSGTAGAGARIGHDKSDHAVTCYGIELTLAECKPFKSWKPWQRTLFTVGVIGGGKEWYDSRHPDKHDASWGDIAADTVGAIGGESALWLIHKSF